MASRTACPGPVSAPWLALMLITWLLAACGPGVGGTGTGEEGQGLQAFGAEAREVCASELAPLLACAPASPNAGASGATGQPSAVRSWWSGDGGRVQLGFDGNRIGVQAECGALEFRGLWGQVGTAPAAYYGWLRADGGERPAVLQVQRDDPRLLFTLIEADARVRLGPSLATRQTAVGVLVCP